MIATLEERRAARAALIAPPPEPPSSAGPEPPTVEPEPIQLVERPEPTPRRQALTKRYRPRCLAELAGQGDAVAQLSDFVAASYPTAFIFAGDTGTGKTSAAWALAADLGCAIDANPPEWGGVSSIPSGEHTPALLQEIWPKLWTMPFQSRDGWRVLIINEVEKLSSKIESLWLDRLEELPNKLVIVFTTNDLDHLPDRFVDRCGVIEFVANATRLAPDARRLAESIWHGETGADCPADVLDAVVKRATRNGHLSFRRVVQALTPLLAARKRVSHDTDRS